MQKICICGGGSLAHVCAGVLSSQAETVVNVLTRKPWLWSHSIVVTDLNSKIYRGKLNIISNEPQEVVKDCDIVLLCLPGFAIESTLKLVKPFVGASIVGSIVSSTGFFLAAHRVLGNNSRVFGFQRVPYIARTSSYGSTANLLGYKSQLAIAVENVEDRESFRCLVESLWKTPTKLLNSYYEASLTNSNPLLHTARLYTLWKNWNGKVYDHNILFYEEWTIEASQLLIDMDNEFIQLLKVLKVDATAVPSILNYYDSYDAVSLTNKIKSIPAFQNITSPMIEIKGGWIPDFKSRYFIEDFPFGLQLIVDLINEKQLNAPNMNMVLKWGRAVLDRGSLYLC